MDEEFVVVYEFQLSLEEFKEATNSGTINDSIQNNLFPINNILNDNNIFNYNDYEVASANDIFGNTISDKSPNTYIHVRVYVKKQYESLALEIINSQVKFEEPDELKGYEPIEDNYDYEGEDN